MRWIALVVLTAFLFACTKTVRLPPEEIRHLKVDWEALNLEKHDAGGVILEGMAITPAQWPLEESARRLFRGDFAGFVDAFDFSFQSSRIPEGPLEDLFELGYLAAYVRIRNPGERPRSFLPGSVALEVDGSRYWRAVPPRDLPPSITEIDWERAGKAVLMVGLVVVLMALVIASGRRGRGGFYTTLPVPRGGGGRRVTTRTSPEPVVKGPSKGKILLWDTVLQPGEAREGMLLFRVEGGVLNWATARLTVF